MNRAEVHLTNGDLYISDSKVETPGSIQEFEIAGETIIALLDRDHHSVTEKNNVIGINPNGETVWRIAEAPKEADPDWYSGIFPDGDDLWVTNLSGLKYRVDPETGESLEKRITK